MTLQSFRLRSNAVVAALALSGLGAYAQATPPTGTTSGPMAGAPHAHRMAEYGPRTAERHAQRLDALKAKLQLNASQQSAWNGFVNAVQERPTHLADHRAQYQAMTALNTPERLERMKAMRTQHQAEMNATMDRRIEATRSLYASLTPEQQKVFDAETARMMQGLGRQGEHRHGGHGSHDGHGSHHGRG